MFALSIALGAQTAGAQDAIELHGASQFGDEHAFTKSLAKFGELVKECHDKPINFVLHKNRELGLEKQYFEYMSRGRAVDYAIASPAHMSTFSIATATRGWAKELVGDRIRVNAVSPGVIMTPFHERFTTAEQLTAMQARIPMDRLGQPDDCAGAFLYLASDSLSGYVTGQNLEVNGGQYMP